MQVLGFHRDGGFAEYVVAARRQCIGVPSKLPPELAVLAEPMACGLNALDRIRVRKGERLLIIGAGTVGLLLAIAATARGAFPEMVETSPEKRKRSTPIGNRLGIPIYDKPGTRPPYAAIIPAAPTCSALESALQSIEPGGRLCLFSGVSAAEPVTPPLSDVIHYRQLSAVGAYGCTRKQMRQALALLAIHQDSASQLVEKIVKLEGVAALFPEILEGTLFKCVVQLDSA
jgi:threonine dehydrogenase-like Zn-dependent dehydrogenase